MTPLPTPDAPKRKGRPRSFDRTEALEKALRLFWQYGYEPVSVASLCAELGICPPSFYVAFKSKEALFVEAVLHYEKTYWAQPIARFEASQGPIETALTDFFAEAADILLNPNTPNGCMVVLAAVNLSAENRQIAELVRRLRRETRAVFERRFLRAADAGELLPEADAAALADAANIFLEGMSIQARDGLPIERLKRTARLAAALLEPFRPKKGGGSRSG